MKNKLIVALDVSSLKDAEGLVDKLFPEVRMFKIGSQLFTATGPDAIRMVQEKGGKVFLDLKFHDIPNTVASACEAALRHGVFMLNIHTLGGIKMMKESVKRCKEICKKEDLSRPILLGVTILTSMDEKDLRAVGIDKGLDKEVLHLAGLAKDSGLDGVVASPHEIDTIRRRFGSRFIIVTPGVRPLDTLIKDDQKRTMTPGEAIKKGADYIVIGRPVTSHSNPLRAARQILEYCKRYERPKTWVISKSVEKFLKETEEEVPFSEVEWKKIERMAGKKGRIYPSANKFLKALEKV
ncbi:MAG: orotidine-5'-phosphate decarboxylase [Candidatus Omnitrophica bacterium]|nr:orotidine-5'-phosphate decarboxylase [Candidatus Omnitrophota bacterium]